MSKTGLRPIGFKVIIKPEEVDEKTVGGIIIPEAVKEQEKHAVTKGVLIEVADQAFTYAEIAEPNKPKVGDTVYYSRYAGTSIKGNDGQEYRLCNDEDITAVVIQSKKIDFKVTRL